MPASADFPDESGGKITIGGSARVIATGGKAAAGIGNGNHAEPCGSITIEGNADVTASSTSDGAGIGGGANYGYSGRISSGPITISGGTVRATGEEGAAIGGGLNSSGCDGPIKISGGTVIATSKKGAAIGNSSGTDVIVEISGGIINASTMGGGVAIGTWRSLSSNCKITIDGDVVFAKASSSSFQPIGPENKTSLNKGVVFQGTTGTVYGSPTLPAMRKSRPVPS